MNANRPMVNHRLKEVRFAIGIKRNKLADELHISNSHLANIENGKRSISVELICGLYEKYQISSAYLLFGIGSMFVNEEKEQFSILGLSDAEKMDILMQLYHYIYGYKDITMNGKVIELMDFLRMTDEKVTAECKNNLREQ